MYVAPTPTQVLYPSCAGPVDGTESTMSPDPPHSI